MALPTYILEDTQICINEDAEYSETEILNKRLSLRASTWMKLYEILDNSEDRAEMRVPCIKIAQTFRKGKVMISEPGTFISKFASSAPYHYFLTTVYEAEETSKQSYSVSLHEILDYTGGEIVESLHINFMVDLLWITTEYMLAAQNPKMTILYGEWLDPDNQYDIPFDFEMIEVEMLTNEFACHHSKISFLKYKDNSIRIIISTANLYALDWQTRSEGLWISPLLPHLPDTADDTDGESPTNFKRDLIEYLSTYKEQGVLGWEALVHRTDCSAVNVFFIASVPGSHEDSNLNKWGHKKLASILSQHAILPSEAKKWPIVAQSSAVGVFGDNCEGWLTTNIALSMSSEKDKKIIFLPDFKFIYPSQKNHDESFDSKEGASCLMYNRETHLKQQWLKNYLYQWKAEKTSRTQAMPHLKCYTRISPDESEIPWFVLTSSNLSKGAWGKIVKKGTCLHISNYEAGVVFIPQLMIDQTSFPIKEPSSSKVPVFLLPYDLPLTPYEVDDEPFVIVRTNESTVELEESQKPDENSEIANQEETQELDRNILDLKKNQKQNEDV